MIDLLYHATIDYEILRFAQESEPATLMHEMVIEKAKAHKCNILEYKDHRRPSGHGNNGQHCGKCGKSHE